MQFTKRHDGSGERSKRHPYKRWPSPGQIERGYAIEVADDIDPLIRAFFMICEERCLSRADILAATAPFNQGTPLNFERLLRIRRGGNLTRLNTMEKLFSAIGCELVLTQVDEVKVTEKCSNIPGLKTFVKPKEYPNAHRWVQDIVKVVYYYNLKYRDVWRSAGVNIDMANGWLYGKEPTLQKIRPVLNTLGMEIAIVPITSTPPASSAQR